MDSIGAPGTGAESGLPATASGGRRRPASQIFRDASRSPPNITAPRQVGSNFDDVPPEDVDQPMVSMNDSLQQIVSKELGKFLPSHVTKSMQKQAQELRSKTQALQRTKDRKKKLESEITMLEGGQLPPGVPKCPHTFETSLLDSPVHQDGLVWNITLGDYIRETKEKVHLFNLLCQRHLALQLIELHRQQLKEYVKKSAFISRCSKHVQNLERPSSTSCALLDIDEDGDDSTGVLVHQLGLSEERFHGILLSIYKKVVDGEAAKKVFDMEAGDKKQKEKEKFLEQVANKSPLEFFNEAIDQRLTLLSKKGKGKGKASPGNASLPSAELTLAAVHSSTGTLDKQELQNIIADCPNHELSRPKPKSKARARAASGKGKGKSSEKPKGKGKNKASHLPKGKGKGGKGTGKSSGKSKNGLFPLRKGAKVQTRALEEKQVTKDVTARRWQR